MQSVANNNWPLCKLFLCLRHSPFASTAPSIQILMNGCVTNVLKPAPDFVRSSLCIPTDHMEFSICEVILRLQLKLIKGCMFRPLFIWDVLKSTSLGPLLWC